MKSTTRNEKRKNNVMKEKVETTIVKCEKCGKLIQPNAMGVPVDYVWQDGRSLCHECNKKEAKK